VLGVLLLAIATQRSSAERPASSLLPDAEPPRAADAAAPEPTVAAIAAVEPEALPPSPAPPASAPDRSDDRPARGAAAPRGATGEPPGRAAPSPDQAAAEPVAAPSGNAVLEATAEPTEATPPPAAAVVEASPPCLVLTSRPSGAFVWIDGAPRGSRARSRPEAAGRVTPGEHRIGMSLVEGEAQAEARAVLRAGAGTLVHCDLMGTPTCRVSSAAAALCAP
jgi:nicotinate-nucleotide--dimethylbenzimidazole phosphoribosyltransferase